MHFATMGEEKVNLVRTQGKYVRHNESDSKEEATYLDKEMEGF